MKFTNEITRPLLILAFGVLIGWFWGYHMKLKDTVYGVVGGEWRSCADAAHLASGHPCEPLDHDFPRPLKQGYYYCSATAICRYLGRMETKP